jgi:hypothetical protein
MNWNELIKHDGGTHAVEVYVDGDNAVIHFGSSFTLRVDEQNIDKLRELLFEASRSLAIKRSVISDSDNVSDEELESADEIFRAISFTINNLPPSMTEEDFIQAGIDAREQQKTERMEKDTVTPVANDPINW